MNLSSLLFFPWLLTTQEALGLDILVHGEAERTDMVEFFAQQFEGFAFTTNGWVQVRRLRPFFPEGGNIFAGRNCRWGCCAIDMCLGS